MKRTVTLTTALLALITGPAFAGDMHEKAEDKAEHAWHETKEAGQKAKQDSLQAVDKTQQEMQENLEAFSRYDENNDGELEQSELTSYYSDEESFANLEFDKIDTNSDDIVSEQEWREHFNTPRETQQPS